MEPSQTGLVVPPGLQANTSIPALFRIRKPSGDCGISRLSNREPGAHWSVSKHGRVRPSLALHAIVPPITSG
jgi:hypothetical protein